MLAADVREVLWVRDGTIPRVRERGYFASSDTGLVVSVLRWIMVMNVTGEHLAILEREA